MTMLSSMPTFGFLFIWISCQVSAVTFHQSSPHIVRESSEVHINCSHDDSALVVMLWYQHNWDNNSMTLIGYGYESSQTYEGQFEKQYKLTRRNAVEGALTIRKADLSHSAVYYCAASTQWCGLMLLPHSKPSACLVHVMCVCVCGFRTCFVGKKVFGVSVKEHKDSLQLSALKLQQFFMQLFISVNNYEPAYFGRGTKLTVLESGHSVTPPSVKVLPPSQKECRNKKDQKRKKTLVCVATGFYPDHVNVSWTVSGVGQNEGVATDSAAVREGKFYRITSRLRVPADVWFQPDNQFTCNVEFFNGTATTPYSDSINGETGGSDGGMSREKYLRVTQSAKLSYGVFMVKSCIYGAFVSFLVWKLQSSAGKQKK
ncbi:M1-specific T cell receptor beta chain-like [Odontesthes bonariensis]|uniref:M1-specific T cell receptor beta chain-like n=1 Tax=Odontesthes bonariensis TaxID=219752 RepID=UPI003F58C431